MKVKTVVKSIFYMFIIIFTLGTALFFFAGCQWTKYKIKSSKRPIMRIKGTEKMALQDGVTTI